MSMNTKETTSYLVSYFNAEYSTRFRMGAQDTIDKVDKILDMGWEISEIKSVMRNWDGEKNLHDVLDYLLEGKQDGGETEVEVEPQEKIVEKVIVRDDFSDAFKMMSEALVKTVAEQKGQDIMTEMVTDAKQSIKDFIQEEYGTIKRKTEIEFKGGEKIEMDEITHEKFEEVLAFINSDEPVFLSGAAGAGKNVICKQVAKALGLDFYFSNAVTQEHKITGFTDANGNFHETQFYKAFKNGGLFLLDEMDASIPEVLIILNAAIANKYFDFPAPIGYVEAHENFRVVAAGNTFGHGASFQYVGRNQLDMASLDRFAVIEIKYDNNIDNTCACGDGELVEFIKAFRIAADNAGINVIASYRAVTRLYKMTKALGYYNAMKTCLIKNLERDDMEIMISEMDNHLSGSNEYYHAMKGVMANA